MSDLSHIAQVDRLLNEEAIARYIPLLSRPVISRVVKAEVERYREKVREQALEVDNNELMTAITNTLDYHSSQRLQRVVNATGILVHTNFGRSPVPEKVWQEAQEVVTHYSNLESNIINGKRGNRMGLLPMLLETCFGAEASLLVNNNAAAMHLMLRTLAHGKEVIVSRGHQVQIGGGFRIPEILEESGAILRDVGTTNITTIDDYLNAINENTIAVLLVHQSNYYIEGFTKHVDVRALAAKLPPHVLLLVDQGSGNQYTWVPGEPSVASYLKAGAHIVCFSADKMLGSTQGGILLGRKDLIAQLAKQPMMRAFRPGKETYAVLERVLVHRLNQNEGVADRVEQIVNRPESWHKERAEKIAAIAPEKITLVPAKFMIGGGTTPRAQYDTWAVTLDGSYNAEEWLKKMRQHQPPIMGVVQKDQALLYPVTLMDEEFEIIMSFLEMIY
ncbi:MAG: L-seryl-tRNA(Sec) selenium transferase [Saezia sp.]